MKKIRSYLRLYLEESFVHNSEEEILNLVMEKGEIVNGDFKDNFLFVLFWETLFFSDKFKVS